MIRWFKRFQYLFLGTTCIGLGLAMLGSVPGAGIFVFSLIMIYLIEHFKKMIFKE